MVIDELNSAVDDHYNSLLNAANEKLTDIWRLKKRAWSRDDEDEAVFNYLIAKVEDFKREQVIS